MRKCDTKEIQEKSVQTEGMIFANVDGTEKVKRNREWQDAENMFKRISSLGQTNPLRVFWTSQSVLCIYAKLSPKQVSWRSDHTTSEGYI